jgi:hypothetical protein
VWWQEQIEIWEREAACHLPLLALSDLDYQQRLALLFAGLVEEDSRFGTLFAHLQAPLSQRRPGIELVAHVFTSGNTALAPDPWRLCRPLLESGLVLAANEQAPRSEWVLQVSPLLWDVVRGEAAPRPTPWCRYRPLSDLQELDTLLLPATFHARLAQVPALLHESTANTLALRGIQGSERSEIMGAVARALGRNLLEVPNPQALDAGGWRQLGPICAMSHSMPVLHYDLGPGETATVGVLGNYRGPLGLVMGREGGLRGEATTKTITLTVPLPTATQRRQVWKAALGGHPANGLNEISERFHLPTGHIRHVAGLAVAEAALAQQPAVGIDEVRRACRALNRQLLDTLAAPVPADGHWGHLVVSDGMAVKLRELEQRCRHRERLLDHTGPAFGRSTNRGVRALFSGTSGTGKTMAARILAAELGMDLYRVDLAAVVNKYIGETEKNLHHVLSTAEALDVILLLDEGDALLGNRTEVRSANDRYANLETNFLLQRLESYQGIVVITSNAAEKIDSAFQRRLDVVIHFVVPQAEARRQIWELHLPAEHTVEPALLEELAVRCEMTGGQIRNAALHATLLSLTDGIPVGNLHLRQAVQREYDKAGAHSPLHEEGQHPARSNNIQSFLEVLA